MKTEGTPPGSGADEEAGSTRGGGGAEPGAAGGGGSRQGGVPGDTSDSFTARAHDDSGGGSAQLRTKGGDNSIQDFGSEASASEFEGAAATLHAYLDARAARAWRAACGQMASGLTVSLAELGGSGSGEGEGTAPSCPEVLASLTIGLGRTALREGAVADAVSLRVEGERGYLLFHGARKIDYFMPMAREDGTWKVAAVGPSPLS
jgi:hypothetical protein